MRTRSKAGCRSWWPRRAGGTDRVGHRCQNGEPQQRREKRSCGSRCARSRTCLVIERLCAREPLHLVSLSTAAKRLSSVAPRPPPRRPLNFPSYSLVTFPHRLVRLAFLRMYTNARGGVLPDERAVQYKCVDRSTIGELGGYTSTRQHGIFMSVYVYTYTHIYICIYVCI